MPDVLDESKKLYPDGSLHQDSYMCVEFSIKTADDDTLVLETWTINVTDKADVSTRVSYGVYNRMSIMLKSVLCATRITPAYSLSRKQGPETYVFCYRLYNGEPYLQGLGDGYLTKRVGSVPTPTGTLQVTVNYRTKLAISPHSSMRGISMQVKDDHFTSEEKGRDIHPIHLKSNYTAMPCYAYKNTR